MPGTYISTWVTVGPPRWWRRRKPPRRISRATPAMVSRDEFRVVVMNGVRAGGTAETQVPRLAPARSEAVGEERRALARDDKSNFDPHRGQQVARSPGDYRRIFNSGCEGTAGLAANTAFRSESSRTPALAQAREPISVLARCSGW